MLLKTHIAITIFAIILFYPIVNNPVVFIAVSILLAVFAPLAVFGFFLGYSLHLLADSFTKAGITPFWPYSRIAKGHLITGGVVEKGIFFMFVFLDILTAMVYLF